MLQAFLLLREAVLPADEIDWLADSPAPAAVSALVTGDGSLV